MNAYYHNTNKNISNNDIFKAYLLGEAVAPAPSWKRHADSILAFFVSLLALLTCSTARRLVRVFSVAVLLVALVGVIGAVEAGTLGLGWGFTLGVALLGIEFFTLRKL